MPLLLPGALGHLEHCIVAHLAMKLMLLVEMMYAFSRDESRKLMGSLAKASENQ